MTEKTNFQGLEGKQVLLTGGCGFIGSEVTKQLSGFGANITIIDNLSSGKIHKVGHKRIK